MWPRCICSVNSNLSGCVLDNSEVLLIHLSIIHCEKSVDLSFASDRQIYKKTN